MKSAVLRIFLAFVALFSLVYGGPKNLLVPPPLQDDEIAQTVALSRVASASTINGTSTFQQYIDHNNPGLGTFSQQFWWNAQYWKGPGSPIVLFTPGEIAAALYTGYLTNRTITGLFAEAIGGAVVMLEHRYWGQSSPYQTLTTENLQYLTLQNAIADLTHFAETVNLPFDPQGTSKASKAPWVFSGGSYSGALAAWTESTAPGTFWAYHASSAPVEAIYDYWQYFAPVQEGMAKNCSTDLTLVIDYIDNVLTMGTTAAKQALKDSFGLGALEHDDDFASALQNGPWLWQANSFYTGYSGFFQFCDYIENVAGQDNPLLPSASGVGLTKALAGYVKWANAFFPGYCAGFGYWTDPLSVACFDTYNASSPLFTDVSVGNSVDRQWQWMLCNQPFAYWQDGAPKNTPTIVSRLVTAAYWQRQCGLYFPTENGYTYDANGHTVHDLNGRTGGWKLTDTTRLIWTNGQFDPWRTSGVSSEFRPGGPLASTPKAPLQIIPGGFHCSDLIAKNGLVNDGVQTVIDNEIKQIVEWVKEYPEKY
ncbi:hypothetical protein MMC30_002202 [Trapelia coarctata]|nr:hypothetical protein [Trapelia coarctata]